MLCLCVCATVGEGEKGREESGEVLCFPSLFGVVLFSPLSPFAWCCRFLSSFCFPLRVGVGLHSNRQEKEGQPQDKERSFATLEFSDTTALFFGTSVTTRKLGKRWRLRLGGGAFSPPFSQVVLLNSPLWCSPRLGWAASPVLGWCRFLPSFGAVLLSRHFLWRSVPPPAFWVMLQLFTSLSLWVVLSFTSLSLWVVLPFTSLHNKGDHQDKEFSFWKKETGATTDLFQTCVKKLNSTEFVEVESGSRRLNALDSFQAHCQTVSQ